MLKIDFSTRTFEAEIKGDLQEIIKLADAYLSDALQQGVGQAVQAAPKYIGDLGSSINTNRIGTLNHNFFAAVFFAPYMEFGTGSKVRVPSGYEELARESAQSAKSKATGNWEQFVKQMAEWARFKGIKLNPGQTYLQVGYNIARKIYRNGLAPRPYLIPAFEAAIDRFEKDFNDINV